MATCKECLYYEPCLVLNAEFKKHPKDFIETDLCAKQCTTFKDRSRFVELPFTHHGKLIDADYLRQKLEKHRDMCGDIELSHGIDVAISILNNVPTIIEAEVK